MIIEADIKPNRRYKWTDAARSLLVSSDDRWIAASRELNISSFPCASWREFRISKD
ncbi:hypothetical protein [Afipia felis]|uniref:hypothetical protein n=1 Tax=Afipia felis TaxID=1035 RepID=UPI000A504174|nr:hypothetical protein [Afipia felis]